MLAIININAFGANRVYRIKTDQIARLFGTLGKGINITSIDLIIQLGTSLDISLLADWEQEEPDDNETDESLTELTNAMESQLNSQTRDFTRVVTKGYRAFWQIHSTATTPPPVKEFDKFEVFNNLVIGWTDDVDFRLEIEYDILNRPLNYREEIMDLLRNKRQVEDPNISNVLGKRQLVPNPLRLLRE